MSRKAAAAQSLVEFALIIVVLMVVFMGVFDFGYAVYAYNTISLAAREGARAGAVCSASVATIQARAQTMAVGLNLTNAQVIVTPQPVANDAPCNGAQCPGTPPYCCKVNDPRRCHGDLVNVTVNYTYTPFTLLIAQALGASNLTLSAQSTMVVE